MWSDDSTHHNVFRAASGPLERPADDGYLAETQSLLSLVLENIARLRSEDSTRVRPLAPTTADGIVDDGDGNRMPAFDRMMIRLGGNGF